MTPESEKKTTDKIQLRNQKQEEAIANDIRRVTTNTPAFQTNTPGFLARELLALSKDLGARAKGEFCG
jgi:hypothetical protein